MILLTDFQFSPSKTLQIQAVKSFLDEDDSYKLQINGNSIEDSSREYVPPESNEDEEFVSENIEETKIKTKDKVLNENENNNEDNDSDEEEEESRKTTDKLKKKMKKAKENIDEVDDFLDTEDKKALKSRLKKMMKLLKDLDSEEVSEELSEEVSKEELHEDSEEKIEQDPFTISEEKSLNKEEAEVINIKKEKKTDLPPLINDDFSILDSPNSESDTEDKSLRGNLRKSKNSKTNGQGCKAKNHNGEWDKVKIFDNSDWPDVCK